MTIDLSQLQQQTFDDFSGGLNTDVSRQNVRDNEVIAADNVVFNSFGSIESRLGEALYKPDIPINSLGIVQPVRGMHRYRNSSGARKFFIVSGDLVANVDRTGVIYSDDNAGQWTEQTSLLTNDGFIRFAQYKNALFMGTDRFGQRAVYADDVGIWTNPSWAIGTGIAPFQGFPVTATSTFTPKTNYFYRYTYDIFMGGKFLYETGPVFQRTHDGEGKYSPRYIQPQIFLPTSTNLDSFEFEKRSFPSSLSEIDSTIGGATIKRINIYRRQGLLDETVASTEGFEPPNFFYIGSIDGEDFDAASSGDILFTDDGIPVGAGSTPLVHGGLIWPPYGRFMKFHKGRMWLAHTTTVSNEKSSGPYTDANLDYEEARVYYSTFGPRGSNLLTYFPFSWIDVAPDEGEPITGLAVTKNDVLLVFKPNSIHAIRGGDASVGKSDEPSIRVTNVSRNVGCVAPESIIAIDNGIVFASHLGMYVTDGNTKPVPIDENKVQKKLLEVPDSRKYFIASGYDEKEQELWVTYSHPDTGSLYNREANVFSRKHRNWTHYDVGASPTFGGIAMFENKHSVNEKTQLFFGRDETPSAPLASGPVGIRNASYVDRVGNAISWSFQTKFYDMGHPYANKRFRAVLFHLKTIDTLTLDVQIDGRLDTQTDSTGKTIPLPTVTDDVLIWGTGKWGEKNWGANVEGLSLVSLDDRMWGHRISLIVSGTSKGEPVEIQSITVFYEPLKGVRF